ncbi:MDL1 [[Candida] subhashii]|uniref:MDL1 n=1 Tax=[Candida] subhashii TaxID=561895 RepID=A0A8J5QD78_9ASCO|nr:MDL1 [[Candida] subhashii]KAG7662796.1 MDL1 [[Candida] subhashii]
MIGINRLMISRILPLARSSVIRIPKRNTSGYFDAIPKLPNFRSGRRMYQPIINQLRYNSTSTTTAPEGSIINELPSTEKDKKQKTNIRKDVAKLLRLAKPEFRTLIWALLCLFVTSATTMTLPLFIGKIIDTAKPVEGEDTKEEKSPESKKDEPVRIFGLPQYQFYTGLGILFVIGASANFGRLFLLRSVGERLIARLRSRLFSKILAQDAYFFDVGPTKTGMKTGDLISRIASDTQIISKSLSMNISDGMRAVISGCVGLSMMCFVSWKLTLCMSMMFPPLIVMSWFYGRKIKALSRLIQENVGAMTKVTEEKLNGVKTIQSFSQQLLMVRNYNEEIKNIFNSSMREAKYSGFYYSVNGFIGNTTLIGLLVVGVQLVGLGELTIGDLSSFMMYAVYTGSSVFGLGNFYTELMKGIGAAERIFELVEYQPRIPIRLGKKVEGLNGDIKFEAINFTYPSRPDSEVFKHMNLTIKKGENVCLVGPSGCGKSTVSQLLLRFYDPVIGNVFIGDENIRDLNLNHYRTQLGYVSQDAFLFSGSIKENVLFGKDDATKEQIEKALVISNAKSFIDNLPHGLETPIGGSNSTQLSGGQRQRVSLARTLIREPKILILDEATSALDSISEEMVMKNLQQLNKEQGITIISIAHRLSTIKGSDRIVVFNQDGEIVEDDSFDILFNDPNSEFNKLLKNNKLE